MPPRAGGWVRRRRYRRPLPSERHVLVSPHAAQASDNASVKTRGCPSAARGNLSVTTAEPASEVTSVAAVAPARGLATPPTHLHYSPRRLADGSRPLTPEGSRPPFGCGDRHPYPPHYR